MAIFKDHYPTASPSISTIRLPSYSLFFTGLIDWILSEDLAFDKVRGKLRELWVKMIETRTIMLVWELHQVSLDHINQVNEKLHIASMVFDSEEEDEGSDSGEGGDSGQGGKGGKSGKGNSPGDWGSITSLA